MEDAVAIRANSRFLATLGMTNQKGKSNSKGTVGKVEAVNRSLNEGLIQPDTPLVSRRDFS
jgi:hypothetical protein